MKDLFENHINGAKMSPEKDYRYALWRVWDDTKAKVMFIGLNPSTANESENDPTIRRVIRFARDWGYGGVFMLNLFPFVTPYPEALKEHSKIEIERNDLCLHQYGKWADRIVFAWGNFKEADARAKAMAALFPKASCLGKNKNGTPKHPLYIKADTWPIPFSS